MLAEGDDRANLFTEADLFYEAMLASISGAQRRVYLESCIFANNKIG